ncbi:MAG: hypothetical protein IKV14_03835 [Muribaculaceae bacterium]|nr:hypothetical protein [Muribaculaceae bacterium]
MKRFGFYLFALLFLFFLTSCEGDGDSLNSNSSGIVSGEGSEGTIDMNNVYGGWISNLATSQNSEKDYLYSIYIYRDNTVEGYWCEGKDVYGIDEYSYFTGRLYISGYSIIITALFQDADNEEETFDDITILKLTPNQLQIREGDSEYGTIIEFMRTTNIVPSSAISQELIYGTWMGKAPADDEEYIDRLTINQDNTISGRWYEGDNEYSQFVGDIELYGREVILNIAFYDEDGEYSYMEEWDGLTMVQLTENTMVVREEGDEDMGELFSYVNYCMYKPGGENTLPQPGDVYMFTSAVPQIKNTNLTYLSANRYKCSNSGGEYYIDIEAVLTKLTGGTFVYNGDIGIFSARSLNSSGFASLDWDMGAWNRYKIVVDPNISSYSRTQQIEIEYSYYYDKQVSGTAIITIEQDAYQSNTGGNSDNETGGGSTQIVTGKVSATVDVIGPGLNYDSYAQYIDGKTCTIEYTYNPSTGEYYIYAGPYSSNPEANGGKGLRHKVQKGYNSIVIMQDYWLEYRPNSVVPIKYDWEARLKFTIP